MSTNPSTPDYGAVMSGWDADAYRRRLDENRQRLLSRVHVEAVDPQPPIRSGLADRLGEVSRDSAGARRETDRAAVANQAVSLARRYSSMAVALADPHLASAIHPDMGEAARTARALDGLPPINAPRTGNTTLDNMEERRILATQRDLSRRSERLNVLARYRYGRTAAEIASRMNAEEDAANAGHGEFWRIMHTDLARLVLGDGYRTEGIFLDKLAEQEVSTSDGSSFDRVRDNLLRTVGSIAAGTLTVAESGRQLYRALGDRQFAEDDADFDASSLLTAIHTSSRIADASRPGAPTMDQFFADPLSRAGAGFLGDTITQSLPYLALTLSGPMGWGVVGTSNTGDIARQRAQNEGRSVADIGDVTKAIPFGVTSALFERLGGKIVGEAGTIAGGFLGGVYRTARAGLGEAATEGVQSFIEYMGGVVGTDREWSLREMGQQTVVGMLAGFSLGAGMHAGVETASSGYRATVRRAGRITHMADSEASASTLDTVMDSADKHAMRRASPDTFRQYLAAISEGTPAEHVYVSVEAIDRVLQQDGVDPGVSEYLDGIREQIDEARTLGGDVVMPLSEFATAFAGTQAWAEVQPDARTSPSLLSPREMGTERGALLKEIDSAYRASQGGNQTTILNIGMNVDAEGTTLTRDEVIAAVKAVGGLIESDTQHTSDTEPTLVVSLAAPLTTEQAHALSVALKQDAIAQVTGSNGELIGPKAAEWGAFSPEFFIMPDGTRLNDSGPLNQGGEGDEIAQIFDEVKGQLVDIGIRAADASKYAAVYAANRMSQASAMGMTPLEYHRANPVEFVKEGAAGGTVLNQAPVGKITPAPSTYQEIEAKAAELADIVPGFEAMLPYLTTEEKEGLKAKSVEKLVDLFEQWPSAEEMASVAYSGRAKRGWYERSALALLDVFGPTDAPRFAALLAALSPQTSVEANAVNALKMWTNWDIAGRPTDPREILNLLGKSVQGGNGIGSVLNAWINNSVTALTTESPHDIVLSGPKVNSFMLNLMGVMDEVTNDAWMANFALIDQSVFAGRKGADGKSGKGLGYKAASAVVRKAADILTERTGELWTPAEVQETVWSWVKTLTEKRDGAGPFTAEKILEAGGLTHADIAKTPDFAQLFIRGVYRRVLEVGGYSAQVFALESGGSAGGPDSQQGSAANPEGAGVPDDTFTAHLKSAAGRIEKRYLAKYAARQDDRQLTLFQDEVPMGGGLYGLPTVVKVDGMPVEFGPFQPARDAAERVARRLGLQHNLPKTYAPVDVDRAERIAAAFEAMAHAPADPEVKAAYDALVEETLVQWDEIKKSGLQVEFIVGEDPYGNPRKAVLDVVENNHLWVFPADDGFGSSSFDPADNPLLAEVPGEFISGRPVRVNDIFRIVHDYFGYIMEGVGFRARGEENAWRVHSAMFSPLARKALTTETRGQNSWVNFGPRGAENRTADAATTVYADQKVGLLPDWVVNEGVDDVAPAAREHAMRLRQTAGMQDLARRVRANSDGTIYVTEDGSLLLADKDWIVADADRKASGEASFSKPGHPVEIVGSADPRLVTAAPLAHQQPPINDDGTVTVVHYSSANGLTQLDPEFWGTSGRFLPPSERSSIGTAPGRTYFGIAPGEPGGYAVEFGNGTNVYTARVPASRLYPVGLDPEGVVKANPRRWEAAVAALPGYDGYWMNHGQLGLVAAVFAPTQVQQSEWQTYYQDSESIFYSEVEKAVRAGQNKATAAQWKATLTNTAGVKAEELMEWTGLGDMLTVDPTAVLTKDDLLRVVENGRIEIFETVKSGTHTASVSWSSEDEQYGVWADDDWVSWHDDQDEAIEAAEAWDANSAAKWSAYTVDGHSAIGYREILLRIPSGFRGNPSRSPDTHWEEQGVIAHIRFSEQTDSEGKRVMFLGEMQSDWHQKGREFGYEQPVDAAAAAEAEARLEAAREAETKALKAEGEFALSAFGIDDIQNAVAKLERGETRLRIVAATADNALTDKIMGDLHYSKQSASRNVRKDSPEEVYAENFEASYRYSRAVKAGYPGSAIDADTAFAFSQYVDLFGLASGHDLKDRVDAAFEASDYGKHIALVEARRALSNDRALRGRELDVARGAITNGGVPRAPFRNTWHVLAMRRAIRWAAEQGFDRIAWIRGNEQNGGQTVVTAGKVDLISHLDGRWTLHTGAASAISDKVAALRKSDGFKGEKGDKDYVYTSDEIRAVFNTYDDRLGDRMVEQGSGEYDASHVGVADDGHFFYDRMLVNDTNALIKKYKAKVAPAKIKFAGRGRPDTITENDLRVMDEREAVEEVYTRGEERRKQIREELGRNPATEDFRADEQLVAFNDAYQAAKLNLQLAIRAVQAEENQRWADGLTSNPAFDITPEMREAALKGFPMFQGDNRPAGARGQVAFSDSKSIITVFENADLSTLLHETGHVFFEEMRRNIMSGKAPDQMQQDWAALRSWLSENGQPVVDNKITREGHELIARGFERYLMEGKPPSAALEGAFASFRNWLISIYRTVAMLRAPITPEVRKVFDRLLATDEEITTATDKHARALLTEKPANMTAEEFNAYRDSIIAARNEAYNRLLEKTMRSVKAMRLDEYRAQRNEVREAVAEEIKSEPRFRALDILRGDMRLDRDWLVSRYGEDALNRLPKGPILVKRGGDDADFIAETAGFGSGAEMVEALFDLASETEAMRANGDKRSVRDKIINDRVTREMEQTGAADPLKDAAIEAEAMAAIHGERQGEVFSTELKTLGRTLNRRPTPYRVAREWAARKIAASRVNETISRSAILGYSRASDKAGKLAEEAFAKGDMAEAFRQKQAQLINHALVAEARKAATEVERIVKRMQRLSRRAQQKSVDAAYFERVQQLLALFDFKPVSQKMLDEREGFLTWAAKQAEAGFEVLVPERLIVNGDHYSRVAVSILTDLDNSVASLMALGRMKQKLADAKSEREFKAVVEDMVTRIRTLPERKLPNAVNDEDRVVASIAAPLLKIETLAEELDGGPTGPFNSLLVERATQVENLRAQLRDDVYTPLANLYLSMSDDQRKRLDERVTLPDLPHRGSELDSRNGQPTVMTRMELLAVALNVGNSSNFDKLARGEQWTPAAINRVLDRELTQEDWQFVQAVWDALETLWPHIAATEREMSGVVPERVENRPVVTRFGTFRGGYYPVVYDPNRSIFAENNSSNEANDLFGMKAGIGTPKGHTIARTDAAGPIKLSVEDVLLNHIEKVITRVAYAVYTRDVLRTIDNARVARAIDVRLGREYRKQVRPWLQRNINSASVDRRGLGWVERLLRQARINTTLVAMGFRWSTGVAQIAGLTASAGRVGAAPLARGIRQLLTQRGAAVDFVMERSPEMARRHEEMNREVADMFKQLRGKNTIVNRARAMAFWHIAMVDRYVVAVPTWLAGFQNAIDVGETEAQAIALADKAVRTSQGSGREKDLANWQSPTSEATRWLSLFYTYFNVHFQSQWQTVRAFKRRDFHKAMMLTFWFSMAAPLADALLSGDLPDFSAEDDDEKWYTWFTRNIFFHLFSGVPVVRDLAAYGERSAMDKFASTAQTPIGRIEDATVRAAKTVNDAYEGDPGARWVKTAIETPGYFLGLPTGQAAATGQFMWDVATGNSEPEGFGDWYAGLTTGRLPEDKN